MAGSGESLGGPDMVHVIVTCANRMSRPIPEHLQLGQVPGGTEAERARGWIARLAEADSVPLVPAVELYAGEHWSVARRFPLMSLPGEEVRLWACSAGYGLIPAQAPVVPHHATLTPGQADSVPGPFPSWWSLLGEWAARCQGILAASAHLLPRTQARCSCSSCRETTCARAARTSPPPADTLPARTSCSSCRPEAGRTVTWLPSSHQLMPGCRPVSVARCRCRIVATRLRRVPIGTERV